jgi:2-aminoadipate transaminase
MGAGLESWDGHRPGAAGWGGFADALRLCFASTPPDPIHEGVTRLRRAVDKLA